MTRKEEQELLDKVEAIEKEILALHEKLNKQFMQVTPIGNLTQKEVTQK